MLVMPLALDAQRKTMHLPDAELDNVPGVQKNSAFS